MNVTPYAIGFPSTLFFNCINGDPMLEGPRGPRFSKRMKCDVQVVPTQLENNSFQMFSDNSISQGKPLALNPYPFYLTFQQDKNVLFSSSND